MKPIVHEQNGVRVAVAVQVVQPQPSSAVVRRAAYGAADGIGALITLCGRTVAGCTAIAFWGLCRVAQLLLHVEDRLGGSHRRLSRVAYWLPHSDRTGIEVYHGD